MESLTLLPISAHLEKWYGVPHLPDTCLIFDTETSGFLKDDVITEISYAKLAEGKVVDRATRVLNWTRDIRLSAGWLARRLKETREQMTENIYGDATGTSFDFTMERLSHGDPPNDVLRWFAEVINADDTLVIGHSLDFDERFVAKMFSRFLYRDGWSLPDHRYFDTLGFARASWARPQVLPTADETAKKYFRRAARANRQLAVPIPSLKLEELVRHYGWEESGLVKIAQMHTDSGEDVEATRLLYAECRKAIAPSKVAYKKGPKRADDWN